MPVLPILQPRATHDGPPQSGFPASTWIPIAVVISVLTLLTILACTRKGLRRRIAAMGNGVAVASGGPITRELTAEQLAGSINRAPSAPARRTRRPRRTPSQISTVSLPAYMKEPGEQELVVTRGPDGEDVAMPAASAVVEEDDEQSNGHEDNERYSPMPQSPHDTPLLDSEQQPDPRGEAPAYFEVVDVAEDSHPPGISVPEPEPTAQPQRRSGFFSMFRSAPPVPPIPPSDDAASSTSRLTLTHTRTRSTTSPSPINSSRHRPSPSTTSLFSLGRKKSSASLSANNLTSPSLISLASISHPLPHTLLKTEFTALPKGGLTPEQLSLISGTKEGGLGRFGVPWGEAAVRYASTSASASRVALPLGEAVGEAPPPGWEEVSAMASGSGSGEASGSGSGSGSTEPVVSASGPLPSPSPAADQEPPPPTPTASQLARADSRASGMSAQTFATAEEGHGEGSESSASEDEASEVRIHIHVQEPTDATVRPASTSSHTE